MYSIGGLALEAFLLGEETLRIPEFGSPRQFLSSCWGSWFPGFASRGKKVFLGFDTVCGSEQWVEEVGGIESPKTRAGHGNL